MSILEKIVEKKRERLTSSKYKMSLGDLKRIIAEAKGPRDFQKAIKRDSDCVKIIAEIKKASPSRGLIRADFDPVKIASIYEEKMVDAISVITEEDFFQGSLEFIPKVRKEVTRPVLRKDFIFDEYQIYEARASGADAFLLIAALLSPGQSQEYLHLGRELGMATLFEVHDFKELEMALHANAPIIGINNRNLKTMEIDLKTCIDLKKEIPSDRVVVAESGIRTRDDMLRVEAARIDAVLIGTAFMESENIGRKLDELRGTPGLSNN